MKKHINKILLLGLAISLVACGSGGNSEKARAKAKAKYEKTKVGYMKAKAEYESFGEEKKEKKSKSVKTQILQFEDISRKMRTNSTFVPKSEVAYTAPAGEIVKVNYKNGDMVKAGDMVLEIESEAVKGNYLQAEANYLSAKASYEETKKFQELNVRNNLVSAETGMTSAKEAYEKALRGAKAEEIAIKESSLTSAEEALKQAEFSYERNKKLYEEKLISESAYIAVETAYQQALANYKSAKNSLDLTMEGTDEEDLRSLKASYDRAVSAYNLAKKNIDEKAWEYTISRAEAQYKSAKANYEIAKDSYDDLTVETKIDGVISGLTVKKYEETGKEQTLFTVVNEDQMELVSGLTARELVELDKKSEVEVYVDDLEKTFKGKIVEIDPTADASTNKFNVKVIVENSNKELKKGMFSKVFFFSKAKKAFVVPKEAIVIKDLYTYVFKNNNGTAERIRVDLGIGTDDKQEITADEIKEGDRIVVEGQFFLQDNEMIKEVE